MSECIVVCVTLTTLYLLHYKTDDPVSTPVIMASKEDPEGADSLLAIVEARDTEAVLQGSLMLLLQAVYVYTV